MKAKPKKNSKKNSVDEIPFERSVSSEAVRGVFAILIIAFAAFLSLAGLGGGGKFGVLVFAGLSWLFGVGYILVPLLLFISSILIFKSFERKFGGVQMAAMTVFLLSNLGLINVAFPGQSGVLGSAVSRPFLSTVDTAATVFFLIAFLIASLVVAFDIHLGVFIHNVLAWFKRPDEEFLVEEHTAVVRTMPETETEDAAPIAPIIVPAPERVEKITQRLEKEVSDNDAFPILASFDTAYVMPPLSLLGKNKGKPDVGDVKANMNIIKRTFQNFGIQVEMDEAAIGPTVTRYSMKPAEGVRLAKVVALQSNLELALSASPVRIEAPIPGKSLVGIEVPNIARTTLGLGPMLMEPEFSESTKPLLLSLGRSISGAGVFSDLAKMPHVLIAGTTGSGKSVTIHDFVVSLLYRCGPERLRFIMVDPKRVELTLYNSIPHLLTPVITDAKKCILALKWLAKEMDRRYNVLETFKVRDISSYHQNVLAPALEKKTGAEDEKLPEAMPYIVLIIDELADIMTSYPRELEGGIVRLAQMSRAVGIHLLLSTQRPSVKVITGLIKANIPARVALQVSSQIDSRTILDMGGAEKLLGAGDTLFLSGEMSKPQRIQAAYISEDEVKRVVAFILKNSEGMLPNEIDFSAAAQKGNNPAYAGMGMNDEGGDEDEDELYSEAKRVIIEAGKASTSYLQRKLGVGYARAARLMDMLEDKGVIGAADGAKPRNIIGAGNADELATEPTEAEETNAV